VESTTADGEALTISIQSTTSNSTSMGYSEIRIQREIQQLRREVKEARTQEKQTRQGCLDLVHALEEFVTSLAGSSAPASAKVTELVNQARVLLTPTPTGL